MEISMLRTSKDDVETAGREFEGTLISVKNTFIAVQDNQSPPRFLFFSLNNVWMLGFGRFS